MRRTSFVAFSLLLSLTSVPSSADDDWTEFRGPRGMGIAANSKPPVEWSESSRVVWKTPLAGKAWSSPVVFDGHIWLTNADEAGKRLSVVCLDKATGSLLQERVVFENEKPQFCYPFNSYASSTPVIEAGRLYAHFGSHGTACIDTASGETLWERRDLPCDHHRGAGSSPVIFDNLLLVPFDGFDVQYVVALDKQTGETVWKRDRDIDFQGADGDAKKAYGTIGIAEIAGRTEAVASAALFSIAYDPKSGREIWRLKHGGMNTTARPMFAHGLTYVFAGDGGNKLTAIRQGGSGDITKTHVAWTVSENVPTRLSPLIVGELLFMVNEMGIATCLVARTGERLWQERLGGEFTSSPVCAGDRIYAFDQEGAGYAFHAARKFEMLGEGKLDAGCMATPAIAGDALLVRTKTHLYCLAE